MNKTAGYLNNEFVAGASYIDLVSSVDNTIIGQIAALTPAQINSAFDYANEAFKTWSKSAITTRIAWARDFAKLLSENSNDVAKIVALEINKPFDDALQEVKRTVQYIESTIETYQSIYHTKISVQGKIANLYRVPLGVVLAISPFNYPVNLALAKIVPAILAGNTVVFKPATYGSLTGYALTKIIAKTNLPRGVFNLVTGKGSVIGPILTNNKHIKMITFTGSEGVGKGLAKDHSLIPIVLELGGNDLAYVRFDSDLDLAAKEIASGAFGFSGQRCTAIKRVLVHERVYEAFLPKLLAYASKIKPVHLITKEAADYAASLIEGKILAGGTRQGNAIDNTISLIDDFNLPIWTNEAFGPILPLAILNDESNLVNIINQTRYGLQASIFTNDIAWAKELALMLEVGTVNLNRSSSRGPDIFPFSGIKDSGFGVQGIKDAILSMTRVLNVVENH